MAQESTHRAYSDGFFRVQAEESRAPAEVVVPLLLELHPVRSVLDVGGGVGAWASVFLQHGIEEVTAWTGLRRPAAPDDPAQALRAP